MRETRWNRAVHAIVPHSTNQRSSEAAKRGAEWRQRESLFVASTARCPGGGAHLTAVLRVKTARACCMWAAYFCVLSLRLWCLWGCAEISMHACFMAYWRPLIYFVERLDIFRRVPRRKVYIDDCEAHRRTDNPLDGHTLRQPISPLTTAMISPTLAALSICSGV